MRRARWISAALAATLASGLIIASGGRPSHARSVIPHFTLYVYNVKVGIKGGTTLSNSAGGSYDGDMVQEHGSGSFSIDAMIRSQVFSFGNVPGARPGSGGGQGNKAVVNGTWTDKGTKWIDVVHQISGPFTCAGKIDTITHPPAMALEWKRKGSNYVFTLQAVQQELVTKGSESCPNDSAAGSMGAIGTEVYKSRFSIPVSQIGRRTIVKQVSGPLAENRKYLLEACGGEPKCQYNVAWQGTVRFTRTRVIKN